MNLFRFALYAVLGGVCALAAGPECDRACLRTALDQYLSAVIKHDPAAAPLSPGFRQTENAVVIKNGEGAWKSVTGLGKLQRRYLDPVSEQAAYFGVVDEGEGSAIVTVRVKVDRKKVAEAEWYMARKGDPGLNGVQQPGQNAGNFFDPDNLAMNPPPEKAKDPHQSREAMIAATNSYFDGITTHDGSIIWAYQGCMRVENGNTVTGRARGGTVPGDCTTGLQNINVALVGGRRYPVVDEEAGMVLAMAVFIRKPGTTTRRNAFSEWFAIENGKIRSIWSAMFYPAPDAPVPNWPPYEGNWPIAVVPPAAPAPARGKQ